MHPAGKFLPALLLALLAVGLQSALAADPKTGSPADDLPPHIRRLSWFGERPDWSPDGKRLVFLGKVFGEVYEYELATGRITPCSDHFRHHGFTRAQYLSNGDLLLSGPIAEYDRLDNVSRQQARSNCYLFVLDRHLTKPPVSLGVRCDEGPAVSRSRLRVAWTHGPQDRISIGDIVYENGTPRLANIQQVLEVKDFPADRRPQRWIETQSFVPPEDRLLTVTAYELNGTADTETYLLNLDTHALTNLTRSPDTYDECEGVFPDGKFTTVERAPHHGEHWVPCDLYKVALDGTGSSQRLTRFTDYPGYKGTQGVVSDDGRFLAFQLGRSKTAAGATEAGQGFGFFLFDLTKAPAEPVTQAAGRP